MTRIHYSQEEAEYIARMHAPVTEGSCRVCGTHITGAEVTTGGHYARRITIYPPLCSKCKPKQPGHAGDVCQVCRHEMTCVGLVARKQPVVCEHVAQADILMGAEAER